MVNNKNDWPGVSVSPEMREQMAKILSFNGYLEGIDQKDLLVIAASIALKDKSVSINEVRRSENVIHPSNLRVEDGKRYRAFICMLNYEVNGNNLSKMTDKSELVKTFVEYAAAGLSILEANYLNRNIGNKMILDSFRDLA